MPNLLMLASGVGLVAATSALWVQGQRRADHRFFAGLVRFIARCLSFGEPHGFAGASNAGIRSNPLRRHFVPPKVAADPAAKSPDGAIGDGFASRNGATIRPLDHRYRLA